MSYIGITDNDLSEMLEIIGTGDIDSLFSDIPESIRLKNFSDIPESMSEIEASVFISNIADKNNIKASFLGAGAYNHYIPAAVDHLSSRSEFYTAYTPYQPEVSQGTLTAIFEFQSMLCSLTGMDVTNASMYDGATSLAESVLMSVRDNKKKTIIVSKALHPNYAQVLRTYCQASEIKIKEAELYNGITGHDQLNDIIDDNTGAIVFQSPNFFGNIEDIEKTGQLIKDKNINLIITVTEPVSLGILIPPGRAGADIVCGDAQGFGNPVSFGGPMLGFISAKEKFMRKMPGRLVGQTVDMDGKEAYVLTLQTREQHIRRHRATSNICTNQGLIALRAVIYLTIVGPRLREISELNHKMASYLKKRLFEKGFEPLFNQPYFNEFAIKISNSEKTIKHLKKNGYSAGLNLGDYFKEYKDCILMCTTEMNSTNMIDNFIETLESF